MNLDDIIRQKLQEDYDERKDYKVEEKKFSPSAFGSCYRRQIWQRRQEEVSDYPDPQGLIRMAKGRFTHRFVQSYLPEDIVEVKIEIDDIKGYADIVMEDRVVDIKASDNYQLKWKNIPTDLYAKKNPQEFLQVAWYAKESKKKFVEIRNYAFGSLFPRCKHKRPTEQFLKSLEEELKTLREWWDNGEGYLPPAEPRLYGGRECNYCQFKTKCKEYETLHHQKSV